MNIQEHNMSIWCVNVFSCRIYRDALIWTLASVMCEPFIDHTCVLWLCVSEWGPLTVTVPHHIEWDGPCMVAVSLACRGLRRSLQRSGIEPMCMTCGIGVCLPKIFMFFHVMSFRDRQGHISGPGSLWGKGRGSHTLAEWPEQFVAGGKPPPTHPPSSGPTTIQAFWQTHNKNKELPSGLKVGREGSIN